jgi:hypothetical protein
MVRAGWLFGLMWVAATGAQADSMRCGRHVVSEGMSAYEVASKCGDPVHRDVVREEVTVLVNKQARVQTLGADARPLSPDVAVTSQEQAPFYRDIDRWTYHFGAGTFLREVDFYSGAVIRMRTAGRAP